jgi:hypothetical protein
MGSINDGVRSMECERGPIRVLLTRDGKEIIRITTFAGPVSEEPGSTNLGTVPARDAAAWLLGIATRVDGRPGRDAIMPAALADSARWSPGAAGDRAEWRSFARVAPERLVRGSSGVAVRSASCRPMR